MVLFGGTDGSTRLDETWELTASGWAVRATAARPTARVGHALAYDVDGARVVMFGGFDAGGLRADTWSYDGTTWVAESTAVAPSARRDHTLTYDPVRRRLVLVGGVGPASTAPDVWELVGASWSLLEAATVAPPRQDHGACYDALGQRLIVAGGGSTSLTFLRDRWALTFANAAAPADRCREATVDTDGDGLVGCADPDCWGRCSPTCPPGTSCAPTAPGCGDGACAGALEDYLLCPADCPAP
ncbi:MAG: kelch repeat-containing protein [Kofleriaceae bacterium]